MPPKFATMLAPPPWTQAGLDPPAPCPAAPPTLYQPAAAAARAPGPPAARAGLTCHPSAPLQHLRQQLLRALLAPQLLLGLGEVEEGAHVLQQGTVQGSTPVVQ